jgi:hypothetical protein
MEEIVIDVFCSELLKICIVDLTIFFLLFIQEKHKQVSSPDEFVIIFFSYFLSEQEEGDVLFELKQSTPSTDRRASSPVNSARAIGAPSVAGGFGAGGGASRPPDNGSRGWRSARPVLQTNYDNYSPNLALAFSPHTSAQRATNQEGSATLARPPNKNLFPIQRYPVNK